MMKKALYLFIVMTFLIVGCTKPESPQVSPKTQSLENAGQMKVEKDLVQGLFGPGPLNYHGIEQQQSGFRTYQGSPSRGGQLMHFTQQTMGDEQKQIRQIIENNSDFIPGMIMIMGDEVWVKLDTATPLDDSEKKEQLKMLNTKLELKNPQYHYHLDEKKSS
ncbi:hypothetical protein BTS2_4025 [Bacillus sp. TS-2]|nr:hypothetical protein BTS2_4025 [Bacillus sp. TS-2]